jgi:hypothetical protein
MHTYVDTYIHIYIIHTYNISIGEPEGKRSLGTSRRGWEDNIDMYLK